MTTEAGNDPLAVADDLDRIADHISQTLYFASGHLKQAHTKADEKFIRHDDYDALRSIANDMRATEYERLAAEARKGVRRG